MYLNDQFVSMADTQKRWPLHLLVWSALTACVAQLIFIVVTIGWQQFPLVHLLGSVLFVLAFTVSYLLLTSQSGLRPFQLIGFASAAPVKIFRFVLGPGVFFFLLALVYAEWRFEQLPASDKVAQQISLSAGLGVAFLVVILAPLLEEIVYRQLLLQTFAQKSRSMLLSALLCALLFSLSHSADHDFIVLFVIALFLTWVRLHFQCLWYPVILHSLWNLAILLIFQYRAVT
jgi:membrane protease YdiL (CAAX protease family)